MFKPYLDLATQYITNRDDLIVVKTPQFNERSKTFSVVYNDVKMDLRVRCEESYPTRFSSRVDGVFMYIEIHRIPYPCDTHNSKQKIMRKFTTPCAKKMDSVDKRMSEILDFAVNVYHNNIKKNDECRKRMERRDENSRLLNTLFDDNIVNDKHIHAVFSSNMSEARPLECDIHGSADLIKKIRQLVDLEKAGKLHQYSVVRTHALGFPVVQRPNWELEPNELVIKVSREYFKEHEDSEGLELTYEGESYILSDSDIETDGVEYEYLMVLREK